MLSVVNNCKVRMQNKVVFIVGAKALIGSALARKVATTAASLVLEARIFLIC